MRRLLPLPLLLAACASPVDRNRLPTATDAAWTAVAAESKFSVGGHMDLTGDVLRNLRGREAGTVTRRQVRDLYDAESKKRADSALAGRTEDQCRTDVEEMARLASESEDRAARDFFAGLLAESAVPWRERLRKAVVFACEAVRPQAEEIVVELVRKVGAFQKRHSWRNAEAVDLVLDSNLATDLHQFEGKIYMFLLYLFYPSGSGQIQHVKRLVAEMPEGVAFNTAATNGFHFDDLFHYDEIAKRWEDLRAWTRHQAARTQERWADGGRDDFLRLIGISSHTVQDFYCHSNWVAILLPLVQSDDPEDFPLWKDVATEPEAVLATVAVPAVTRILQMKMPGSTFDRRAVLARMKESNQSVSDDPRKGGLQTGAWDRTGEKAWEHRHPEEAPESVIAPALAARATDLWIDELLDQLSEAHRNELVEYISTPR